MNTYQKYHGHNKNQAHFYFLPHRAMLDLISSLFSDYFRFVFCDVQSLKFDCLMSIIQAIMNANLRDCIEPIMTKIGLKIIHNFNVPMDDQLRSATSKNLAT